MAGTINEDYATDGRSASMAGMIDEERCLSGESLSEWRSCEQVENGSPSTSPPFWDSDSDDDDPGPKPSELFGRYTWRIEKFSKEKKREMKSEPFEAGGYKWYILVYPQGCDVSNHLSLFLCVANHDKLLPGWSHFAQFTIAVGNVDPKKVKYSDTLHRFWKKEHDWGWKKFMELSKIQDGFLVDDVLEIIAQVQVIREKADRPFRCLDRPYRRELLRVYMTNIEQIYRRFVEERRSKLSKLIEDKMRWSSFCDFWLGIDPRTRHRMSREKTDAILKVVVKHFFVEKEVTSTLVMDSLNTGLKALEYQSKANKGRTKIVDLEELPAPMIQIDMDMFVLAGDVITLLERAALEPLPCQPLSPKDDKCSQSRTKDGSSGEVNKGSIEREERRLTELGRKILEIFVLSHIFSGIEVAYQEAVALKRQEELIREEEAAGLIENEIKGRRGGGASEKEKRAKKKQAKQKKNSRKGKDKERDEKYDANIQQAEQIITKVDTLEEVVSDVSDNGDVLLEVHQPDLGGKSSMPINQVEANGSEVQNTPTGKKISCMDKDSSTCSAVSVAAVAVNNSQGKANNLLDSKSQMSPNRGKNQRSKGINERTSVAQDGVILPSAVDSDSGRNVSGCGTAPKPEEETVLLSLKDKMKWLERHWNEKEQVASLGKKLNFKVHVEVVGSKSKAAGLPLSSSNSLEKPPNVLKRPEQPSETTTTTANAPSKAVPVTTSTTNAAVHVAPSPTTTTTSTPTARVSVSVATKAELISTKEPVLSSTPKVDKAVALPPRSLHISSTSNSEAQEETTPVKVAVSPFRQVTVAATSRPSSAPLVPASRSTTPTTCAVQVAPLLGRSMSETGRSGNEPSASAPSYVPQSYRNAIIGKATLGANPGSFTHTSSIGQAVAHSQPLSTYTSAASVLLSPTTSRNDQISGRTGCTFGSGKSEALNNWHPWKDDSSYQLIDDSTNRHLWRDDSTYRQMGSNDAYRHLWNNDSYQQVSNGETEKVSRFGGLQSRKVRADIPGSFVPHQPQGAVADEFPHIDIINDLLEEEQSNGSMAGSLRHDYSAFGSPFSLRGNLPDSEITSVSGSGHFSSAEQYYDDGFPRMYDSVSALHGLRDGQFSSLDRPTYSNGRADPVTSKPWLYGYRNSSMNLGISTNGYSHQLGDYTNLASGMNGGESVYRRANGHW